MQWEIENKKQDGILEVTTSGPITWDDNRLMVQETLAAAKNHQTNKVLVDHRKLESRLTVLQIDDIPKLLKATGVGPEYKVAILFNPAAPQSGDFKFFEDVSIISSLQFRIFSEHAEAIKWLKAEDKNKKPKKE